MNTILYKTYILMGDKVINFLKSYGILLGTLIFLSIISSLTYYFDILSDSVYNIIKLVVPVLSIVIAGIYLGHNSKEKGWLQGIKFASIFILLLFMISFLIFNNGISLKSLIYYLILLFTSTISSMLGILNK